MKFDSKNDENAVIDAMGYIEALRPDIHVYLAAESNGGGADNSEHGGKKGKQRGGQRGEKEGKHPHHEHHE